MTKNPRRDYNSFHVERLPDDSLTCSSYVTARQVSNRAVIVRLCGEKSAFKILIKDHAWGYPYCPLHTRLRLEEMQAEMLKLEEEDKPDGAT